MHFNLFNKILCQQKNKNKNKKKFNSLIVPAEVKEVVSSGVTQVRIEERKERSVGGGIAVVKNAHAALPGGTVRCHRGDSSAVVQVLGGDRKRRDRQIRCVRYTLHRHPLRVVGVTHARDKACREDAVVLGLDVDFFRWVSLHVSRRA